MTQPTDTPSRAKTASRIIIYLTEELGDARLRAAQLTRYVKEATDLIEKSEHRDHFFEMAAHLIQGIPETCFKLGKALDAAALAAARLDYEEIKQGLKPEKADELEAVMEDARLRYLNRRSNEDQMKPQDVAAYLNKLADRTEAEGRVPVAPMLTLIARLEAQDKTASLNAPKAAEFFRKAAKVLGEMEGPSRRKLVGVLRRVLADTIQPTAGSMAAAILSQAGSREDVMEGFKSANPDLTDADLEKIADQWEKNKDVVKDKTAALTIKPGDEGRLKMWAEHAALTAKEWDRPDQFFILLDANLEMIGNRVKEMGATQIANVLKSASHAAGAVAGALSKTASDETAEDKESRFEEGKPADPTENMTDEQKAEWKKQNEAHKDEFKSASENEAKESRFEEGKPADPTENMTEEQKAEWQKQNEAHKDEFKAASDYSYSRTAADDPVEMHDDGWYSDTESDFPGSYFTIDNLAMKDGNALERAVNRVIPSDWESEWLPGSGQLEVRPADYTDREFGSLEFKLWKPHHSKVLKVVEDFIADLSKNDRTARVMPVMQPEEIIKTLQNAGLQSLGTRYGKAGEFWGIKGHGRVISIGRREALLNAFYVEQELTQDGRFLKPSTRWSNVQYELLSKLTPEKLELWARWAKQGPSTVDMYKMARDACLEYSMKVRKEGKEIRWPIRVLYQADWKAAPSAIGDD